MAFNAVGWCHPSSRAVHDELSCNLSLQLQLSSSAQPQTVNLAAHMQARCKVQPAICRLGCFYSAQLHTVTSAATFQLCSCSFASPAVDHQQSVCYLVTQSICDVVAWLICVDL